MGSAYCICICKARQGKMSDARFGEMQGDKKSVWQNVRFWIAILQIEVLS